MNEALLQSPTERKRYHLSPLDQTGLFCPIDQTELRSTSGPDFSGYDCPACDAFYSDRGTTQDTLREEARLYVSRVQQQLVEKELELQGLAKIVAAAKLNGLIN